VSNNSVNVDTTKVLMASHSRRAGDDQSETIYTAIGQVPATWTLVEQPKLVLEPHCSPSLMSHLGQNQT
jgi:hypothetical protein